MFMQSCPCEYPQMPRGIISYEFDSTPDEGQTMRVADGMHWLRMPLPFALGHINLGHFLPDYTADEELLDVFRLFSPIPIMLEGERGYTFSSDDLRREITGRGLGALLLSNPCNPTGKIVGYDATLVLVLDVDSRPTEPT